MAGGRWLESLGLKVKSYPGIVFPVSVKTVKQQNKKQKTPTKLTCTPEIDYMPIIL